MKELSIQDARTLYALDGKAREIALSHYGEKELKDEFAGLPTTWEGLCYVSGHYIDSDSEVHEASISSLCVKLNRNLWPTKEEAAAALALSQLCQLRNVYNNHGGEWKADWNDDKQWKFSIEVCKGEINTSIYVQTHTILHFKSQALRDRFLENFRDLIETAKPLL